MELGVKDGVNRCHTWFQLQDQSLMLVVTLIVERYYKFYHSASE